VRTAIRWNGIQRRSRLVADGGYGLVGAGPPRRPRRKRRGSAAEEGKNERQQRQGEAAARHMWLAGAAGVEIRYKERGRGVGEQPAAIRLRWQLGEASFRQVGRPGAAAARVPPLPARPFWFPAARTRRGCTERGGEFTPSHTRGGKSMANEIASSLRVKVQRERLFNTAAQ